MILSRTSIIGFSKQILKLVVKNRNSSFWVFSQSVWQGRNATFLYCLCKVLLIKNFQKQTFTVCFYFHFIMHIEDVPLGVSFYCTTNYCLFPKEYYIFLLKIQLHKNWTKHLGIDFWGIENSMIWIRAHLFMPSKCQLITEDAFSIPVP